MHRLLALVLLIWLVPCARASGAWSPPVRGGPLRLFDLGRDPFVRGAHRGVDLAAVPGEPVRAACGGVVRFAGRVAGTGTVSTTCGRWHVSYAPLERIAVRRHERIGAGRRLAVFARRAGQEAPGRAAAASRAAAGRTQAAGRAAAAGRTQAGSRAAAGRTRAGGRAAAAGHAGLHFGVRLEGRRFGYVDPLPFLAGARQAPPPVPLVRRPRRGLRARPSPHPVRPAPAVAPWTVWLGLALLMTGVAGAGTLRRPLRQTGGAACRASSTSSSSPTTPSRP